MRCQQCGKRLPILRKLTDSEFCSPEHRRAFQEEQERHALSRLLEASQLGRRPAVSLAAKVAEEASAAQKAKAAKTPVKAIPGRDARKEAAPEAPPTSDRFFPLRPEGTRPTVPLAVPPLMRVEPELLLPEGLSRSRGRRPVFRMPDASLLRIPTRSASGSVERKAPAPAAPLAAAPVGGLFPRRKITQRLRVATGRLVRVRMDARRGPSPAPLTTSAALAPSRTGSLPVQMRPLCLTTEWVPPRKWEATRAADLAAVQPPDPLPLAAAWVAMPTEPLAACEPRAVGLARRAEPRLLAMRESTRLLPLALSKPESAPALRPIHAAPLADAATALVAGPLTRAWSPGQESRERRIRGAWLTPLPPFAAQAAHLLPAASPVPCRFPAGRPQPPAPVVAERRGPDALGQLFPLPARYCPEPRRLADRGKTLYLTVMARTQRVDLPPLVPSRSSQPLATGVKAAGESLFPLTTEVRPQASPLRPAGADTLRVYRSSLPLEMDSRPLPRAMGAPKRSNRLVRWIPNLSGGVRPTDLASADSLWEKQWQRQHLKPVYPHPALRPEPARTQKQGLVPDALRQLPFNLGKGSRFWSLAPADLRWAALVLPVVIALGWYSLARPTRLADGEAPAPDAPALALSGRTVEPPAGRPARGAAAKAGQAAIQSQAGQSPAGQSLVGQASTGDPAGAAVPATEAGFFDSLREKISRRAAVEVSDDFRNGLSAWEGNPGWSDGWSYDQAGFVRPGSLALLRPTVHLTDYTFEFLGGIEHRALSWVYRAKDTRNYYAGKLVVVQGGPLPRVQLVRYRVVNGREEARKAVPIAEQVRLETMYRVKIDVSGNDFTTSVLGKVVDTYSDSLHTQGGVGFFSARGEEAKIRWVELSHQYDTMGRLCAFLAPPRIPSATTGGTGLAGAGGAGAARTSAVRRPGEAGR